MLLSGDTGDFRARSFGSQVPSWYVRVPRGRRADSAVTYMVRWRLRGQWQLSGDNRGLSPMSESAHRGIGKPVRLIMALSISDAALAADDRDYSLTSPVSTDV